MFESLTAYATDSLSWLKSKVTPAPASAPLVGARRRHRTHKHRSKRRRTGRKSNRL
jgi:hypothetical protein